MSAIDRPPPPRVALTIQEACQSLGVSPETWKKYIASDMRIVRVGERKLVPVAELERWADEHAEAVL